MEWPFEMLKKLSEFQFTLAVLISFTAGLITSFNPCMLGMASSVISFQNNTTKQGQTFIGFIFMLSFAIILTLLGYISSFFGEQLIHFHQSFGSMLYLFIGILFIGLGSYIFGLRIKHLLKPIPIKFVAFYTKSKRGTPKKSSSPYLKAATLGSIFGVTPSPCTTPMILAMLGYSMMTGSALLGSLLLFAYGIGHGIPFLVMAWITGKIKRNRKMIRWNRLITKTMGVILVIFGIYFVFYDNASMSM
jgi:cytochrome c-type biogenesis protein